MNDPQEYEANLKKKLAELMHAGDMLGAQQVAHVLNERAREERKMNMANFPPLAISGAHGDGGITNRPHSLEEMMAMRMRWGALLRGAVTPWAVGFMHMAMHQAGDQVHIWIITKDSQSIVLEDESGLYPSDALITKIRLLQRGE